MDVLIILALIIAVVVLFFKVSKLESKIEILEKELFRNKAPKPAVSKPPIEPPTLQQEELKPPQTQTLQAAQKEPSFWQMLFSFENLLVKLGALVLFFGLAFLAKYAIEHSIISVQIRLMGLSALGLAILFIGYRLKSKNRSYSLVMQALGVAVFYLTIFSASKIYGILPLKAAFVLMLAVVILGSYLAIAQNSKELAIFSISGGFLAPILTSSNSGNHILLFGYYTLLNIGLLIVAYKKAWRALNITGFIFTFIIATIWGVLKYKPELFASTEPFLIIFFAIYLIAAIFYTRKHSLAFSPKIDTILTFALPFIAFALQLQLVEGFKNGDAASAIALGVLYLGLWRFLKTDKLIKDAFLLIGALFLTLAAAYIFSSKVTAAIWALEGAAVIFFVKKAQQKTALYFGGGVQLLGLFIFAVSIWHQNLSWGEMAGYILITASIGASFYTLFGGGKTQKQYSLLILSLWIFWSSFNLPPSTFYIPLLNIYELSQAALIGAAVYTLNPKFGLKKSVYEEFATAVLGALLLLFITSVLARAFHFYGGIDYTLYELGKNAYFQSSLSVLWALFGLGILLLSKKLQSRPLWFGGFSVLLITVGKLFLIDLIKSSSIERIISFVIVGALLLLVGYLVPLPQKDKDSHKLL